MLKPFTYWQRAGLEQRTIVQYRQHLDLHIIPFLGSTLLSRLAVPVVRNFEDEMIDADRSPSMVRKVLVSRIASRRCTRARSGHKKSRTREEPRPTEGQRPTSRDAPERQAEIGTFSREEIKAIVDALEGKWRPLLLTVIFTGLRASEIRGLRWSDVNIEGREVRVHQRADRFNQIGKPKSEAGERTVPIPLLAWNAHARGQGRRM